jgi:tight adherence protein B
MSEELDQCLKEIKLGAPIDLALTQMRDRVDSRLMATAIVTLLVARRTGGDLPQILEVTAAGLRELDRLEGVLRTKTAESKAQAYVMGAMPFALCAGMNSIDETWLPQLTDTLVGNAIVFVAAVLWMGAIFATRKVLAVNM